MPLTKLDHVSIRTSKVEETSRFYADIIGLRDGPRPPFPFPGAWLYLGDVPLIHLIGVDPTDNDGLLGYLGDRPNGHGTGAVDHVAFAASDLPEVKARLNRAGCPYRERTVPRLGLHQVFIDDPNGVTLELNFPEREAAAR